MPDPTSGNDYLVYVDTADADGSGDARTYTLISGQVNVSENNSLGVADATDKDSANNEEGVATNRSFEFGVECHREEGDTGQDKVRSVQKARRKHYFQLVTAAGNTREFQAHITENNVAGPQDDVASFNFTLKVSGAVTDA